MINLNFYRIILSLMLFIAGSSFGKELLINGGFETGIAEDDKAPSFNCKGWRRELWKEEALNSWLTDGKLDWPVGSDNKAIEYRWGATSIYQYFSARDAEKYLFSVDYLIPGSNESRWQPRIEVQWFDSNNKQIGSTVTIAETDNTTATIKKWTALSGSATAPAETAYGKIKLNVNNRGSGAYFQKTYMDNASVTGAAGTNNLPVSFINTPYALTLKPIFESSTYSDSLTNYADDNDNDKLTFTKDCGPHWLTINPDGTMKGTPDFSDSGDNKLVVTVTDGCGSYDTATIILPVTGLLRPANIFDDDMLFQRNAEIPVWGKALKNKPVTVSIGNGKTVKSTSDNNGDWAVTLPAMSASTNGPLQMTISSGKRRFTLKNLLVGDVWFCSGQSNMDWLLKNNIIGGKEEIASADYQNLRYVKTPQTKSKTPWTELNARAQWQACSPDTAGDFSAVAYYFGKNLVKETGIPIGLINSSQGGTRIENWTHGLLPQNSVTFYNSRVLPYTRMHITGAIWYQAEANIKDGHLYTAKMETLVREWRQAWSQGNFPFYYVQLAPNNYRGDAIYKLPEMWAAQTAALDTIPNSGMAVINDVGDITNIHPKNKAPVGRRLALLALHGIYDQTGLVYSGPMLRSVSRNGSQLQLSFNHVGSGLTSRDGKPLNWFEVAGKNKEYLPATATIDGSTVLVSAPSIANPEYVRFAWNEIAEPNLMNKDGLPANSFPATQAENTIR